MQRGRTMATVTPSQPLSFDRLSGFTTKFCIEKIVASAARSECQTQAPQGILIVGCGGQQNLQEHWVFNVIAQWETRTAQNKDDESHRFLHADRWVFPVEGHSKMSLYWFTPASPKIVDDGPSINM